MPLKFTHIAESIVTEISNSKRQETIAALGLQSMADQNFINSLEQFAFRECSFEEHGGYLFDGTSKVDIALWLRPELAVACELKLGTARLTARRFETEFLVDCRKSHEGKRLAGNMMAILDRRFGNLAPTDGLKVRLGDNSVTLDRNWKLVVQPSVLKRWKIGDRPNFSSYTSCVAINALVDAFGDAAAFNKLVKQMLDFDYFDSWIE